MSARFGTFERQLFRSIICNTGPTEPVDIAEKLGHPAMMIKINGPGAVHITLQGKPTQLLEPGDGFFGEPCEVTVNMKTEESAALSIYFFAKEKGNSEP
jgi:hypothetical protein